MMTREWWLYLVGVRTGYTANGWVADLILAACWIGISIHALRLGGPDKSSLYLPLGLGFYRILASAWKQLAARGKSS